jgi:hypothetical protein
MAFIPRSVDGSSLHDKERMPERWHERSTHFKKERMHSIHRERNTVRAVWIQGVSTVCLKEGCHERKTAMRHTSKLTFWSSLTLASHTSGIQAFCYSGTIRMTVRHSGKPESKNAIL